MVDRDQDKHMQNLGASLVREYLFRMGLKCTLKCMDDELPRSSESFNNRTLLARELKIESFLNMYRQTNRPARSVLEIMLSVFLNKKSEYFMVPHTKQVPKKKVDTTNVSFKRWSKICQAVKQSQNVSVQKCQMINIDRMLWFYRQLSDRGVKIDFQTLVHIYYDCFSYEKQSYFLQESIVKEWYLIPQALKGKFRNY